MTSLLNLSSESIASSLLYYPECFNGFNIDSTPIEIYNLYLVSFKQAIEYAFLHTQYKILD